MPGDVIRVMNVEGGQDTGAPAGRINKELFAGIAVRLDARLGEAALTVQGIMDLKAGAIVTLDTGIADQVELYLDKTLVARGEIVAVDGRFGVRITDMALK